MLSGLVSTIIPVHNRPELVKNAIDSVLSQTYRPIEIIIVDDGSTDQTPQVVDQYLEQYPKEVKVIHQPNSGPGPAREAGKKISRGEFIQYLDSDDILLPRKFELQVAGLRAHDECGISYGQTRFYKIGEPPPNKPWRRTGETIETMFPAFLQSRWWGTSTPLYRLQVIDQAGPWLNLINEEDWEYDCRIASNGVRLHYVPEFVSEQREHRGARLGRWESANKLKFQHRAIAHARIFSHALRGGLNEQYPEMQHFARELFFLSRQCSAVGANEEGKMLFELARKAAGIRKRNGFDFRAYSIFARTFGWSSVAKLVCAFDRIQSLRNLRQN